MLVQRQRLQRTTAECRLQWTNVLAPSLRRGPGLRGLLRPCAAASHASACTPHPKNSPALAPARHAPRSQQPWSAEEDAILQRLADDHDRREWDAVSRELAAAMAAAGGGAGTRPPLACLQRHQQLAAQAAKAGTFDTQEGLARLAALVAKHGSTWKARRCAAPGGHVAGQPPAGTLPLPPPLLTAPPRPPLCQCLPSFTAALPPPAADRRRVWRRLGARPAHAHLEAARAARRCRPQGQVEPRGGRGFDQGGLCLGRV